jgi:hypothetical protein
MGYKQSLDNGVIEKPGKKRRLGSFADLVAEGENPNGLMVQTPNGTSRQDMKQQKTVYNENTDRWTSDEDWDGDMSGN